MASEFTNPTDIEMHGQNFGIVKYGNDSNLLVQFGMHAVHNYMKSTQQGAPIYDSVPFIKIQQPGETSQMIHRPVNPSDKKRFPRQWAQFEAGFKEQEQDGTPIDFLYPGHPGIAAGLRESGIHTVEACANMTAHAMDTIGMGAQDHKNRAQAFMDIGKGGAGFHLLKRENEDLNQKIQTMMRQMDGMRDAYNELLKHVEGKRGRVTQDLPDSEAFIPTRQPDVFKPVSGLPKHMQDANDTLVPPEKITQKVHMEAPKVGKLKVPAGWDKKSS